MGSREVVNLHNVPLFSCCKVGSVAFPAFHIQNGSQKSIFTSFIFNWSIVDFQSCWCSAKWLSYVYVSVQFSSVSQSCLTLCDPMDRSTPGPPVHHQLPELAQTHVHWVGDTIKPSHPLSSPSPPTFNLPYHQRLLQWVSSSHQVAKVLGFQLQRQSFQWIIRTDFL